MGRKLFLTLKGFKMIESSKSHENVLNLQDTQVWVIPLEMNFQMCLCSPYQSSLSSNYSKENLQIIVKFSQVKAKVGSWVQIVDFINAELRNGALSDGQLKQLYV